MKYKFRWDSAKARSNFQKHGVLFEETAEVFFDPLHYSMPDQEHADLEDR